MQQNQTRPGNIHIADALWTDFRRLADDVLAQGDGRLQGEARNAARGMMYLFAVDRIAQLVDRIEREPDPTRRRLLCNALIGRAPDRSENEASGPADASRRDGRRDRPGNFRIRGGVPVESGR